jgi:CRISPR system Cascade subunit CasB
MSTDQEYDADRILMKHLIRLHEDHDKRHDVTARGKLANLRYGMRDRLSDEYPVGRVVPALAIGGLTDNEYRNNWRTVVAGLFGFAHDEVEDMREVSLGRALRRLYDVRQNDSLERRFMALLNADAEHLPGYLRQSISLLKAENIGLDWGTLLVDVCFWDVPGKFTQKKWIRDYYRSPKDDKAETESTADADDKTILSL